MNYAVGVALLLLVGLLTLVSYVDRLYTEIGKFLSREFQDNIDSFEQTDRARLRASRPRASLSMAILVQLTMAAIAMAVGFTVFNRPALELSGNSASYAQPDSDHYRVSTGFCPSCSFREPKVTGWCAGRGCFACLIYAVLPVTLVLGFLQSVASLTKKALEEKPETPAEAVDALIEAGQEEGIIQEATAT